MKKQNNEIGDVITFFVLGIMCFLFTCEPIFSFFTFFIKIVLYILSAFFTYCLVINLINYFKQNKS